MLWQKESTANDAWYIDICNNIKMDPAFADIQPATNRLLEDLMQTYGVASKGGKNNQKSVEYRQQGDIEYERKNYLGAMELYNRSLCHAENHTAHIALAYARRAQCFSGLRMFDKCVIDIELAEKANLPVDELIELEKRKQICSNLIGRGVELKPIETELDFESHELFPEMANVLAFHQNDEYGRHMVAAGDIDVGQVILLEKAFATRTNEFYEYCNICMKGNTNLIPCSTCTTAMYCYNTCDNTKIHSVECDIQPIFKDHWPYVSRGVRTLLAGLNLFSNVDELMEFVEESVTETDTLPTSITDARSQYRVCLQNINTPFINGGGMRHLDNNLALFTPVIYQAVVDHKSFTGFFTKEKHRRFLMHLVYFHMIIGEFASETFFPIILQFMNHSCVPCINTFLVDGYIIGVAFRPIRKGEQVFKCYFGAGQTKMTFAERQKYLQEYYQFQCQCERCTLQDVPPKQCVEALLSDPDYRFLYRFVDDPDDSDQEERKLLTETTKAVLRKHQVVWADGLQGPIAMFIHLLIYKYHNKTEF